VRLQIQEPGARDSKIQSLLEELSSDDPSRREKAAAELSDSGMSKLPEIEAYPTRGDPDLRERIESIATNIRTNYRADGERQLDTSVDHVRITGEEEGSFAACWDRNIALMTSQQLREVFLTRMPGPAKALEQWDSSLYYQTGRSVFRVEDQEGTRKIAYSFKDHNLFTFTELLRCVLSKQHKLAIVTSGPIMALFRLGQEEPLLWARTQGPLTALHVFGEEPRVIAGTESGSLVEFNLDPDRTEYRLNIKWEFHAHGRKLEEIEPPIGPHDLQRPGPGRVHALVWDASNRRIISSESGGKILATTFERQVGWSRELGSPAKVLALSQDGRFCHAGLENGTVAVLRTSDGTLVRNLPLHKHPITAMDLRGDLLITGDSSGRIVRSRRP
jgi:hypothetical protein